MSATLSYVEDWLREECSCCGAAIVAGEKYTRWVDICGVEFSLTLQCGPCANDVRYIDGIDPGAMDEVGLGDWLREKSHESPEAERRWKAFQDRAGWRVR